MASPLFDVSQVGPRKNNFENVDSINQPNIGYVLFVIISKKPIKAEKKNDERTHGFSFVVSVAAE